MTKGIQASSLRKPENPGDYIDFRKRMILNIEKLDPDKTAALALSGGIDSLTLLFAMLETGRRPRCYTFYVEGIISNDLQASRAVAKHFDLELIECMIPCDLDLVMNDVRLLVSRAHVVKKTVIQCMHPWLYICPKMQEYGDKSIITGLGADDLYCTQRKVQVMLNTQGEQAVLDQGWRGLYGVDMNFSTGNIILMGKSAYGIEIIDAYSQPDIHKWFLQFTIKSLHEKKEKGPSIFAFAKYFKQGNFVRLRDAYQIGSGLRDLHDALLLSKEYNPNGKKAIIAVYNLAKERLIWPMAERCAETGTNGSHGIP
jgi:Asparagine synthase